MSLNEKTEAKTKKVWVSMTRPRQNIIDVNTETSLKLSVISLRSARPDFDHRDQDRDLTFVRLSLKWWDWDWKQKMSILRLHLDFCWSLLQTPIIHHSVTIQTSSKHFPHTFQSSSRHPQDTLKAPSIYLFENIQTHPNTLQTYEAFSSNRN